MPRRKQKTGKPDGRFWYVIGERRSRVVVGEKRLGGMIYGGIHVPTRRGGKGDYKWVSLRTRDQERAKRWAAEQHRKLLEGEADLTPGALTIGRLFELYREHKSIRKPAREQEADDRRIKLWTAWLGWYRRADAITLGDWEGFIDKRRAGTIDPWGRLAPEKDRRPVRDRTVAADLIWLKIVLNWGTHWHDRQGRYLLPANPVRGFAIPHERNPRQPVASHDRLEALLEVSDQVLMRLGKPKDEQSIRVRSYLSEILRIAAGTGRRLSAICRLQYQDLRLNDGTPYGSMVWRAINDKIKRETVVPIGPEVRAALDRIMDERPGVGAAWLFPAPGDPAKPIGRELPDRWLRKAERLAGLEPQDGSLWHAFRRAWATSRKGLSDVDVAAAGGWKGLRSLKAAYQQADPETMLAVVLAARPLREAAARR